MQNDTRLTRILPIAYTLCAFVVVIGFTATDLFRAIGLRRWYPTLGIVTATTIFILTTILIWKTMPVENYERRIGMILNASLFVGALFIEYVGTLLAVVGTLVAFFSIFFGLPALVFLCASLIFIRLVRSKRPKWELTLTTVLMMFMPVYILAVSSSNERFTVRDMAEFRDHFYFVETEWTASDGSYLKLYECNRYGMYCNIVQRGSMPSNAPVRIILSENDSLSVTVRGEVVLRYQPE